MPGTDKCIILITFLLNFTMPGTETCFTSKKGSHPATAVYPLFWAETLGVERVGSADLYCFNDIFAEFYNARDGNMFHSARGVDDRLLIQVSTFL